MHIVNLPLHQFYANILVFVNINPFLYINNQFALVNAKSRTPLGKHSDEICTESATENTPSALQFIQPIYPSAQHI